MELTKQYRTTHSILEKDFAMNDPSLRTFIETRPLDEALTCVRSEVLNHVTNIRTALMILEQEELGPDQQFAVQVARRRIHDIADIMNDAILTIVIPRLKNERG